MEDWHKTDAALATVTTTLNRSCQCFFKVSHMTPGNHIWSVDEWIDKQTPVFGSSFINGIGDEWISSSGLVSLPSGWTPYNTYITNLLKISQPDLNISTSIQVQIRCIKVTPDENYAWGGYISESFNFTPESNSTNGGCIFWDIPSVDSNCNLSEAQF